MLYITTDDGKKVLDAIPSHTISARIYGKEHKILVPPEEGEEDKRMTLFQVMAEIAQHTHREGLGG